MALQHTRALQWQAEDLGFGGQRSVRRQLLSTVQGTSPLFVATPSFLTSTTIPQQLLGTSYSAAVVGFNRLIINRSPRCWITLTCTLSDSGTKTVQIPIAPLQIFFLPTNLIATGAAMTSDTTFTVPLPPGVPQSGISKAGSVFSLSFDFVRES